MMRVITKTTFAVLCMFLLTLNLIAGEIIDEWRFDNLANPAKSLSSNGKIKGNPKLVQGVFGTALLLGGSNIKNATPHEYLEVVDAANLNTGDSSFSVECWVKSDDIGYWQFIGKRTSVLPFYSLKGWALGMANSGDICFTIDDGNGKKGRSYAKSHFLSSDWDTDEWNYVVGVRDREKKEIRLYINGELAAKATDTSGNIDTDTSLRIGYDEMAGVFMKGALDEIKIIPKALTAKQIKDNFRFKLNILPRPQSMKYVKELASLAPPVTVILPEKPNKFELTAYKLIKTDLKRWFEVDVATATKAPKKTGTVIVLGRSSAKLHQEGYELTKKANENIITISSNDNGVIYGALTFVQILKKTTEYNNGNAAFPNSLKISDYPSIANRITVSGIYFPFGKTDRVKNAFDVRMRQRLNGIAMGESKTKGETDEAFKKLVDEATKRGITVWAVFGYRGAVKGGLSPLNPKHVKRVRDFFARAGKAGCRAFSFYFDDIVGSEAQLVLRKPEAAAYGKKIGVLQRQFIKIMVEEGNKFGITNYVVCPTPYMRGWQSSAQTWWGRCGIEYADYFKELTDAPGLENVRLYHCDFYPEKLEELRKKGLKKFAYWVNGLWSSQRWFSWNVGPTQLAYTWYGFKIDADKGPIPLEKSETEWRKMAQKTDTVVLGTGGYYLIGGIWLWNPAAFDDDEAVKEYCYQVYGKGAYDLLMEYKRNMLPFVGLFKTFKTHAANECHPPFIKRTKPLTKKRLREYWTSLQKAEKALGKLEKLPKKQKNIFERSAFPSKMKRSLKQMRQAIAKATKKLKGKLKRNGIDVSE